VQRLLTRRRGTVVMLRSSGASAYESLLSHDTAPALRGNGQPGAMLAAWLISELDGPRPYLLVDDVDLLDSGSVSVITRALRRTDARLVMTSALDVATLEERPIAMLAAERAPAEVRTRTLGFVAVNELVSQRLGGAADVGLVSSVAARSAGNPRVAAALVDAARVTGVIGVVNGSWAKLSSLDDVPMDSVVHALLGRLPREEVRALETLAWTGPMPLDQAVELHDSAVWESLSAKSRVVLGQSHDGAPVLAVTPPALAQGLRARMDVYRQQQIVRQAGPSLLEPDPSSSRRTWEHPAQALAGSACGTGDVWRRTVGLDGLVRERSEAVEAMERTRWQDDPTIGHATRYLKVLMRRPSRDAVPAVLAGTVVRPDDDLGERALFALLGERWRLFSGDPVPVRDHDPAVRAVLERIHGLRAEVLRAIRAGGRGPALTDLPRIETGHPDLDGWVSVLHASTLLETGRLAEAQVVCERATTTAQQPRHYLDAIRGEVMVALGDLDGAMSWSRALLDRAYEDLDQLGVRAHVCVLAEALTYDGQWEAAWQVVSASLQLGPAGVLENTFYRRTLSLAGMLRAHLGDVTTARSLLAEQDRAPVEYHPAISSLAVLAGATVDRIAGHGRTPVARLWEEGLRLHEQGLDHIALMHWVLHPGPLDADQVAVVRRTADRVPIPALEPYIAMHEALAAGSTERVHGVLATSGLRGVPALVQAAVRMAGDRPRVAVVEAAGLRSRQSLEIDVETLTRRERQIGALAREGSSNKEIADALRLSRRTVENHMSHVLAKLGLESRSQLAEIPRF
jgi:DNA-binding CsgD family transcriptional regulator